MKALGMEKFLQLLNTCNSSEYEILTTLYDEYSSILRNALKKLLL